ncbi:hypothetical protein ACF0H5_006309 [Mactra antiquata]
MSRRYYVRNHIVPFEEDFTHEFKGHRNICVEDLPPWTQANHEKSDRASRRAVSRALNAFLNTGHGGKVYLGVVDSGEAKGLPLTRYQKDHLLLTLVDVMGRYNPPVKKHRYSVKFVPVCDSEEDAYIGKDFREDMNIDPKLQLQQHNLRNYEYCWCDKDAAMQFNAGIMAQDYIVEIKIKPWDPDNPFNKDDGCGSIVNIHPIHENEEGLCFFRRQASVIQYTMAELAQLTRQEVRESCHGMITKLKREIKTLQQQKMKD